MPNTQSAAATTDLEEALTILFGGLPAGVPMILRDQDDAPLPLPSIATLPALLERDGQPYADAVINDLVPFICHQVKGVPPAEWATWAPTPSLTLVIQEGDVTDEARFYVFDEPITRAEAEPLADAMGVNLDDLVPLPGTDGWAMASLDVDDLDEGWTLGGKVTAAALAEVWLDVPAVASAEEGSSALPTLGAYRDATIRTVFDFEDPVLQESVTISGGANRKSTDWKPSQMDRLRVFDIFCRHNVAADKDGPGVVLGKLPQGNRKNALVEEMHFVGLDFDTGIPGDELAQAIIASGLMAVMASTHSHLKTTTVESYSGFENWMVAQGLAEDRAGAVVDLSVVQARMAAAPKNIVPTIVETMTFEVVGAVTADGDNRDIVITHAPMEKWRAIFALDRPFVVADHATQDEDGDRAWRWVPRALAKMLGGLPYDPACVEPARLWYLPSHPEGHEFRIDLFGGALVNLDEVLAQGAILAAEDADETVTSVSRVSGKTHAGPFDARWAAREAHGFDIVDLLKAKVKNTAQDKKVRGATGRGKVTIRCPFSDDHSKRDTKDAAGCFAANPGAGKGDGFTISCSHGSCHSMKRDRLDHLNRMIADGWFTAEDVAEFSSVQHEPEDEEVDVEAVLKEYAGTTAPVAQNAPPRMAGGVAISGILDGLARFDPTMCVFDGPNAEDDAIDSLGKITSIVSLGNKVRIAISTDEGLTFNVKSDAALWFSSYRALLQVGEDKKGEPKMKEFQALDLLLKSDRVVRYAGIDCDPSNSLPSHVLNTWSGIAKVPVPGKCDLIKAHIKEVICAGSEKHNDVLTKWLGHMFQKPTQKPGFAPVVIGPKGAGKSTIADFIRRAIGRKHSVKIVQSKHLTGNFNSHLVGKLFVQAEEVVFGGDKRGEGPLKDAITSPTMLAEPKGFDAYEESNFSRFFLVTNPGHAVPASDGERRWFVLEVKDLFEGKPMDHHDRIAYFDALNEEADTGGIEAFLDYLINEIDISDFQPYAAPHTAALADQVRKSLSDEDQWVLGVLETGQFDLRDGEEAAEEWSLDDPLVIPSAVVIASHNSHVRRFGGSSGGAGAARRALEAHGEVGIGKTSVRDGRKPAYLLGTRRDWRERWEAKFGMILADGG